MVLQTTTYEEARLKIGTLPSLAPRPTFQNIRLMEADLVNKLIAIPSRQSAELGYSGMVQHVDIYALQTNTPWQNWADPGITRRGTRVNPNADGSTNTAAAIVRDKQAIYDANRAVYDTQENICCAIINSLNEVVPKNYRRGGANTMGARVYRATDEPREIIQKLRDTYGKPTPAEKSANEANFAAPWNPSEPIEELYDRLEDCYLTAMLAKPAFTIEQMIDRALRAIQQTGLYTTAVLEWNGFDLANKTWPQFKEHFAEAYEIRCATGAGTAATHGYANNTIDDDDDSIDTIKDSLNNIQLANNANAQNMNENISAITQETSALRASLLATQQQLAMLAQSQPYAAPFQWPQQPSLRPSLSSIQQPTQLHI